MSPRTRVALLVAVLAAAAAGATVAATVLIWGGDSHAARQAWRAAERVGPDSPSAVRAESLLHPEFAPGRPVFVPGFNPASNFPDSPQAQLALLARAARRPDWRGKILYGVALQRLGRPVSAERQFAAAAALAPSEPEARVAAAVGLFDKEQPSLAFSQLGPP